MNVRKIALDTLCKCETAAQYANLALDAKIKKFNICGDDRALFTVLVYGTIEHKLTLDYYIDKLSSIPKDKIEHETRNILRLGLYQVMYMRTKDYAAVNETVALCAPKCRGFVNAILRNYIRKQDSLHLPDKEESPYDYLSVAYSFPKETCKELCKAYSFDETEEILKAMCINPPLTLRVNTLKISRDELIDRLQANGIESEKTALSPYGIKLKQGCSFAELEKAAGGMFFIQDEASQLAGEVLSAKPDDIVIDMCSCPGSKSFSAAMTMENRGKIYAFDLSKSKLPLIASGAQRLSVDIIESRTQDGRNFLSELEGRADKIICDVPCSGFGVVAKKPDIRYKNIEDAKGLPKIQYDILCNASRYLKKGGTLVYSTCTILPDENERNIEKFLENHRDFALSPIEEGDFKCEKGMITLLPHIHHTDGFFICKLIKTN